MAYTTFRTVTFGRPSVLGEHSSALPVGTFRVVLGAR